jgi:hypothetical protein
VQFVLEYALARRHSVNLVLLEPQIVCHWMLALSLSIVCCFLSLEALKVFNWTLKIKTNTLAALVGWRMRECRPSAAHTECTRERRAGGLVCMQM